MSKLYKIYVIFHSDWGPRVEWVPRLGLPHSTFRAGLWHKARSHKDSASKDAQRPSISTFTFTSISTEGWCGGGGQVKHS